MISCRAILTLIFCSVAATVVAEEPLRLRVLSYNIHHAEGIDRKLDLERIARVILAVNPDIVAIQEVDRNAKRTGIVDQPAELAKLTKFHVAFGPNIKLQGGDYGNAVLSRFPIKRFTNHHLPNVDAGEQRGVLVAEIAITDSGDPLIFYATHFDFRSDETERLQSAKFVNELAAKHRKQPMLLAGDLNATPESKTLKQLATIWQRVNDKPLATVPVEKPANQIDYVLVRPTDRWSVIDVRILDEAVASDHRAIFAELELAPASRE